MKKIMQSLFTDPATVKVGLSLVGTGLFLGFVTVVIGFGNGTFNPFTRGTQLAALGVWDTTVQPSIPSNFDINAELVPAWGTGAIPVSAAPNVPFFTDKATLKIAPGNDFVGAFRFICNASHEGYDDPIVYPGQPGASHLHEFFGNTMTNAYSTYSSLRQTGQSTCNSPVNRSAYWIPAMMNGKGQVVRPDYIAIYYKAHPVDPAMTGGVDFCHLMATGGCVPLPRGLRFVFGYNMSTGSGGGGYFNCQGPTATPGHYASIVEAAKNCPVGNQIGAVISAPDCWDGVNFDSPDHRSHVAYSSYRGQSYPQCPSTHPYMIPTFTLGAWYTVDSTLNTSGVWDGTMNSWHLSSDEIGNTLPGKTLHSDWFGAWDDTVKKMWEDNCNNKLLNCSGFDLGNGKQAKMFSGFSWVANPHLVNPPAGGTTPPPAPTPTPTPTPTPSATGVVSEGDSISVFWAGNHTGIYAAAHPSVVFKGLAVGGSAITTLQSRIQAVLTAKPKVFTVFIGANDLVTYASAQAFVDALFTYTDQVRATGAKVAVATILPQQVAGQAANNTLHNTRRVEANKLIRAAVGSRIDAVIDFAADPVMGPDAAASNTALYGDGLHPTDGGASGVGGQGKLALIYGPVVDALLAGTAVPTLPPPTTPPPTCTFTNNGSNTITWTTTNATSVTIDGANATPVAGGSWAIPTIDETYRLVATGAGGSVTCTTVVRITTPPPAPAPAPAPTCTFTNNGSSSITWTTMNATSVTIDGSAAAPVAGGTWAIPATTHTYTLVATGTGGSVTCTTVVTAAEPTPAPTPAPKPTTDAAPTLTMTLSRYTIRAHGTSLLTWSTKNATGCIASGSWNDAKTTSGKEYLNALVTSTYTLECSNEAGVKVKKSVTLKVLRN
jgi:hypothetical protein